MRFCGTSSNSQWYLLQRLTRGFSSQNIRFEGQGTSPNRRFSFKCPRWSYLYYKSRAVVVDRTVDLFTPCIRTSWGQVPCVMFLPARSVHQKVGTFRSYPVITPLWPAPARQLPRSEFYRASVSAARRQGVLVLFNSQICSCVYSIRFQIRIDIIFNKKSQMV